MSQLPTTTQAEQVASVIRGHLGRLRKTQAGLAAALGLGAYQVTLRMQGKVDWKLTELYTTAEYLGIPVEDLLPEPPPQPPPTQRRKGDRPE